MHRRRQGMQTIKFSMFYLYSQVFTNFSTVTWCDFTTDECISTSLPLPLSSFVLSRISCWLPLCRNAHAINVKLYNRKKAQQFFRAARLRQLFFVFPLKCWWELFKCMCASVEGWKLEQRHATPSNWLFCNLFDIYEVSEMITEFIVVNGNQ